MPGIEGPPNDAIEVVAVQLSTFNHGCLSLCRLSAEVVDKRETQQPRAHVEELFGHAEPPFQPPDSIARRGYGAGRCVSSLRPKISARSSRPIKARIVHVPACSPAPLKNPS